MSSQLNSMEVVILDDKLPRSLTMLVKLAGRTRTVTAHWDIAASQFTPAVTNALETLVSDIINRHGLRTRGRTPQT